MYKQCMCSITMNNKYPSTVIVVGRAVAVMKLDVRQRERERFVKILSAAQTYAYPLIMPLL